MLGDTKENVEMQTNLFLTGKKSGFSSLGWSYETDEERPKTGTLSLLMDWDGNPQCILETVAVTTLPFRKTTEEFAVQEGFASLEAWLNTQWRAFADECKSLEKKADKGMPIVFEEFHIFHRF